MDFRLKRTLSDSFFCSGGKILGNPACTLYICVSSCQPTFEGDPVGWSDPQCQMQSSNPEEFKSINHQCQLQVKGYFSL